jgi:hypothetical protein
MVWVLLVSAMMVLIGWRALALAVHLLSGQVEVDQRLRLYAKR